MNALNYRKVGLFMPNTVQTQEKKIQQIEQHIPLSNQTYPCIFFYQVNQKARILALTKLKWTRNLDVKLLEDFSLHRDKFYTESLRL